MKQEVKAAPTPKPRLTWRTWDHMPGEDLVEMPRALALIRMASISPFLHEATDEDCEAGLHELRHGAHQARMSRVIETLTAHLCDEGLCPTADLLLRALVMAYDTAPTIKAGELVDVA
jgi:hypothetical protein